MRAKLEFGAFGCEVCERKMKSEEQSIRQIIALLGNLVGYSVMEKP